MCEIFRNSLKQTNKKLIDKENRLLVARDGVSRGGQNERKWFKGTNFQF